MPLEQINQWIAGHQAIVVTVGIPLLTLAVTTLTARLAEIRANAQQRAERALQRELRLADYRRAWIEELREELARFNALMSADTHSKEDTVNLAFLMGKIQMKINPEDEQSVELKEKMINTMRVLVDADLGRNSKEFARVRGDFCETARVFLKAEWLRLNSDLKSVDDKVGL